jgi:uncharacterized protein (DUF433 family)
MDGTGCDHTGESIRRQGDFLDDREKKVYSELQISNCIGHYGQYAGIMEGSMKTYEKIEMNPKIMFWKPAIKNTRITVEHILRKLSGGMTIEEINKDHPHLTREDIYSAQTFAADF